MVVYNQPSKTDRVAPFIPDHAEEKHMFIAWNRKKPDCLHKNRSGCLRIAALLCVLILIGLAQTAFADLPAGITPKNWMGFLPDTMQISQINMPGSHDSGCNYVTKTTGNLGPHGAKTQYTSIKEQLNNGLRVFDIRLRSVGYCARSNEKRGIDRCFYLQLCHGEGDFAGVDCLWNPKGGEDSALTLDLVFDYATEFLKANPSETVVMEIRMEDGGFETLEKIQTIIDMTHHSKPEGKRSKDYPCLVSYKAGEVVPTLSEVRGKCVLLPRKEKKSDTDFPTKMPYTNFETEYNWKVKNNDYFNATIKKELLDFYLKLSSNWKIHYFTLDDRFVNDEKSKDNRARMEGYKKTGVMDTSEIQAPVFVSTNLTQIQDAETYLKCHGPETCWKILYYDNGFKDVDLSHYQRTGWWSMDFPQQHQNDDIIKSNLVKTHRYTVSIPASSIPDQTNLQKLSVDVTLSNGYKLKPANGKNPVWQKNGSYYDADFQSFYDNEQNISIHTTLYDGDNYLVLKKSSTNTTDNGWVIRTVDLFDYPKSDATTDVTFFVHYDDNGTTDFRGVDPDSFLQNIGTPCFTGDQGAGRIVVNQSDYHMPTRIDSVNRKQGYSDVYTVKVKLPKYSGKSSDPVSYSFDGINSAVTANSAYTVEGYDSKNLYLKLIDHNEKIWDQFTVLFFDGKDALKLRSGLENWILNSGRITHKSIDRRDKSLIIQEQLKAPFLKIEKIDNQIDHVNALVNKYSKKDFDPAGHEYSTDLYPDGTHYMLKPNSGHEFIAYLMTNAHIIVNWKDKENAEGLRPESLSCRFMDSRDQDYTFTDVISAQNGWRSDQQICVYSPATDKELHFDQYLLSEINVPGYSVEARCEKSAAPQPGTQLYEYTFYVTCTLKDPASRYVDIEGALIWNDADLLLDHSGLNPVIDVSQNNEIMALKTSKQEWNTDCTEYRFVPNTDFPDFMDDLVTPYNYAVSPQPVTGYRFDGAFGFDLFFTRMVSISGSVQWSGTRPVATEPVVQLLCDGEPADTVTCTNGQYRFDDLPISDSNGIPYMYSVEVTVPDTECVILYDEVQRDKSTGNFTANATLVAPEQPVTAKIPVKINILGISANKVTEDFSVTLVSEDDPDFKPQILTLNRDGSFSGEFVLEDIRDNLKHVFTVKQVNIGRNPAWSYDEGILDVTVTVRYLNGKPVAEVDMGGSSELVFTNEYLGEIPLMDITVDVEWVDAEKFGCTVPNSVQISLYDNGSLKEMVPATAKDQWTYVFKDLPKYYFAHSSGDGETIKVGIEYSVAASDVEEFVRTLIKVDETHYLIIYQAQPDLKATDIDVRVEWFFLDLNPAEMSEDLDQVKVTLYADEEEKASLKAKAEKDWTCVFKDQPVKNSKTGNRISYTVTGEDVPGFTRTIRNEGTYDYVISYRADQKEYKITSGDGQTYFRNQGYDAKFICDGPLDKFEYLTVDGSKVDSKHYSVSSGSTILILDGKWLDKQTADKHTIRFYYSDGMSNLGEFNIAQLPVTGDHSTPWLYAMLMLLSLSAMIGVPYLFKKSR